VIPYNFIAVEGSIGAGKTTLASRISKEYNAGLVLERFEDNSFLPKFYKNPDVYAFPLEMSFLADRYQQLKDQLLLRDLFKTFTISDYFIDKSLIFALNNLKSDEFNLYSRLFSIISSSLPKPDLILYLYASVPQLLENIQRRGRDYEKEIQDIYLDRIQKGYLNHFKALKGIPILIVDTEGMDFVSSNDDYEKLVLLLEKRYEPGIHRINPKKKPRNK
jgi:deoxyadenosine/deoxycytidine kinase